MTKLTFLFVLPVLSWNSLSETSFTGCASSLSDSGIVTGGRELKLSESNSVLYVSYNLFADLYVSYIVFTVL